MKDHLPWPPELPATPWPPELPATPWPPLSVPLWRSMSVLRGLQSAHPPPWWNCYGVGHAFREGGELCQGSVVSCVPASCVLIWFVSCPRLMWLLVNSCPAVFVSLSMIYLCIYSPVCSVWVRLVYSLLPVFPVSLAMSSPDVLLNTIIWVYFLVCVSLFLPAVCTVTQGKINFSKVYEMLYLSTRTLVQTSYLKKKRKITTLK